MSKSQSKASAQQPDSPLPPSEGDGSGQDFLDLQESNKPSFVDIANQIAAQSTCDVLLMNTNMNRSVFDCLSEQLDSRDTKDKNVLLILITEGGDPNAAYRISRLLQQRYKEFSACISGYCKSAGTLCVIGAKQLYMTEYGELGPLDIQVQTQDEVNFSNSGLVVDDAFRALQARTGEFFNHFLRFFISGGPIRFKTATEIASSVTKGVFEPIYRQIDPNKVGEMSRYMAIAEAYGERLNSHEKAGNLRPNALQRLVRQYPQHGFVIDKSEAEELFNYVLEPPELLQKLIKELGDIAKIPHPNNPCVSFINS